MQRGAHRGIAINQIIASRKIRNWRSFLACSISKSKLAEFLANDWKGNPERRFQLKEKVVFVNLYDKFIDITSETTTHIEDFNCSHEEADTRMLLLAHHNLISGCKSVVLVVEDTVLMILGVCFSREIKCNIYMRCGTKNRSRLISINKIAFDLGDNVSLAPLRLHAYTKRDTVSTFSAG